MLSALDVSYPSDGTACAAAVTFADWTSAEPLATHTVRIDQVAPYQPGQFYLRELPCLLAVLESLDQRPDIILVDGYVYLGDESQPGLGARLYEALGRTTPVIGVAKTSFRGCTVAKTIYRGHSRQPLYVTAAGMTVDVAAAQVQAMHGPHRLPTLLRLVDGFSRLPGGS